MKVVNDFGKFLTKPEKGHLEKTLIALRERKGYSVVTITLPGLTDNKVTEFTIEEQHSFILTDGALATM